MVSGHVVPRGPHAPSCTSSPTLSAGLPDPPVCRSSLGLEWARPLPSHLILKLDVSSSFHGKAQRGHATYSSSHIKFGNRAGTPRLELFLRYMLLQLGARGTQQLPTQQVSVYLGLDRVDSGLCHPDFPSGLRCQVLAALSPPSKL